MKKVLFVADENFTITGLSNRLETFTINNGCYPDVIEMDTKQVDRFLSLLLYPCDRKKITFNGIKIKEIITILKTRNVGFSTRDLIGKFSAKSPQELHPEEYDREGNPKKQLVGLV